MAIKNSISAGIIKFNSADINLFNLICDKIGRR